MKILIILIGILVAGGGAGYSYYNRALYIQAALYAEGHTLSAHPRFRVDEYYAKHRRFPQDNEQAGLPPPHALFGTSVKHVAVVRDGTIVVQFNDESDNSTLVYTPRVEVKSGSLRWTCASDSIDKSVMQKLRPRCVYVPATIESELMRAIAQQDVKTVGEKLVDTIDLESPINGNTPLMLAAKIGNVEIVNMLLTAGASVDHLTINSERRTPLMLAISRQHAEIVSILLSQGASVEREDYSGKTAMDYAQITDARNGDARFELMLAAQANPLFAGNPESRERKSPVQQRIEDRDLYTRLKFSMRSCYVKQLQSIFAGESESLIDSQAVEFDLRSLVGDPQCSAKLMAVVKTTSTWERVVRSALELSIDECDLKSTESVLAEPSQLAVTDSAAFQSVVYSALRSGCAEILSTLLRHSSMTNPLPSSLVTDAIRHVPQHSLLRIVSILIGYGVELNQPDDVQRVLPLTLAISHEQPVVAKYLVDAGADVSKRTLDGTFAIIEATKKGYHHLVENLIDNGADVNSQDNLGRTALHAAVAKGRRRTVELLLQAGANPYIQDLDGIDAIVVARSKRFESIQAVLEN